jgi:hypothetical protein
MLFTYKIKGDLRHFFTEHTLQAMLIYVNSYKGVSCIISSVVHPLDIQRNTGKICLLDSVLMFQRNLLPPSSILMIKATGRPILCNMDTQ